VAILLRIAEVEDVACDGSDGRLQVVLVFRDCMALYLAFTALRLECIECLVVLRALFV